MDSGIPNTVKCVANHRDTFFVEVLFEENRKDLIDEVGDQLNVDRLPLPFMVLVDKRTRTILGVFRA